MTVIRLRAQGCKWPLPQRWHKSIVTRLPKLEQAIVTRIHGEIPAYSSDRGGRIEAETRVAVDHSLRMFMHGSTAADIAPADADAFRRLGRIELAAGRRPDTIQIAFQIAIDAVVQEILVWEYVDNVPRDVVSAFTSTVTGYISQLARLATDGFQQGEIERARGKNYRLVETLVRRGGATLTEIHAQAAQAGWAVPQQCAVAQVALPDRPEDVDIAAAAHSIFGDGALTSIVAGRQLIIVTDVPSAQTLRRRLAESAPGMAMFLGPTVPLGEADASARLARRAAESALAHAVCAGGVVSCADHLLELGIDTDAATVLLRRRLGPLLQLAPAKRLKLGALLSAWLEFGGIKGDAPGILDASRQTLNYRTHRLQALLGDQLQDRDARLEMMLALRQVLPSWRAGAAGKRR